jgi:hypothetical protein
MTFVSTSYLASSTKTTRTFRRSQHSNLLATRALRQGSGKRRHWRADRPVEKYGDVDHQLKKIRVEGMQSQVLKNRADAIKTNVDAIRTQIELMQQMESVYVWKMSFAD